MPKVEYFIVLDNAKGEERLVRSDGACTVWQEGDLLPMMREEKIRLTKEYGDEHQVEFLVNVATEMQGMIMEVLLERP